MHVQYKKKKMERLSETGEGFEAYEQGIEESFYQVVAIFKSVSEKSELYKFKGLNFEKLKGNRKDKFSVRLNDQWRLTLTINSDNEGEYIEIEEIEDYH